MKGEFPFQKTNPPPQQNHQNGGCRLKKNSKQEKVSISLSEPLITASLLSGHGLRFEFERAWGHLEAPGSRPPFPPPALSLSLSPATQSIRPLNATEPSIFEILSQMCRLHLKHAEVYKAKIKSFVDDAPLPKQVVNAKQQRLVDIVWSHETFAKELLLNEHHPFKDATERQLVLRMLENSYTKKQFHQQVADAKQLQSDLVQPEKMLQKLDLVPT